MTNESLLSDDIHVGTYFAFAIPAVYERKGKYEFVVTPLGDALVHVQVPAANLDTTDAIAVGTSKRYDLSDYDMEVSEGRETKAVTVKSDVDVKVEVIVMDYKDQAAAFLALPVQPHFTQFVTAAYFNPDSWDYLYTMVIAVATEPDTTVNFYR